MSYTSEHHRMRPVLDKARRLDIATHPGPNSLFEALLAGFNLWCTPEDHPQGWDGVSRDAGAFAKPCEYVGTATWGWTDERITHIELDTEAYALRDHDYGEAKQRPAAYRDRHDDIAWAAAKVAWLFSLAGMECPPIVVGDSSGNTLLPSSEEHVRPTTELACPWCGSRLAISEVYFLKRREYLLSCTNIGSCCFREL
jgi:hypothetical protein